MYLQVSVSKNNIRITKSQVYVVRKDLEVETDISSNVLSIVANKATTEVSTNFAFGVPS